LTERLKLSFHLDTENDMNEEDNWEHLEKRLKLKKDDHVEMTKEEYITAQEEAHKHFVSVEFSNMILKDGPTATLALLDKDARSELSQSIINNYHKRLVEANSGL
jgi:hypothetical protein